MQEQRPHPYRLDPRKSAGAILAAVLVALLLPAQLGAQPATDPGGIVAAAIDQLRSLQDDFPALATSLDPILLRFEASLVDADTLPLFLDSCHVRPHPAGLGSFVEARQGILELNAVLGQTGLPPFVATTLREIRAAVAEAYLFLADVALQEARALGTGSSAASQIRNAERQLAAGLSDLARGDHPKAMQAFRQAWQHAQLALPAPGGDGSRPLLNLETPLDGAVLFASPTTVAGMAQVVTAGPVGPEDLTVAVNGVPAQVANRSFQATGVALRQGLNAIVAVATDTAGDTGTACIAVRFDPTPRPRVSELLGNLQTAQIGARLPSPLAVRVSDATGAAVAGVQVVFRVVQGNGELDTGTRSTVAVTDAAGRAQTFFTLGARAGVGVNRVRATAVGFEGEVIFSATATTTAPAAINVVSGDNQAGGVGETLALPLIALVTDGGQNPVAGVPVSFEVVAGGGTVGGNVSKVVVSDENGRAEIALTLGPEAGLDNHRVEARFAGLTAEPATFKASGFVLGDPADTRLSGVVLDNQGAPVPGTTLHIRGTALTATADSEGQFLLAGVPVGHVLLEVDSSTTTREGVWAGLEFDLQMLPGIENTLPKPIYVLPLAIEHGQIAGGAEDVTISVPEIPGFSLTVLAGSATFPDGSATGLVSVTPVHADKIPMPPGSGMQPRFIVTVQPAGAHFDPPAPVSFPNVDGLPPGMVTEMFSFDHDLGEFVSIGTGTVSEDGLVVRSDAGFGIVKAGWHCSAPQSGSGASATVNVDITTTSPLAVCRDENQQPIPRTIEAVGGPPRDAEYTWEISNSAVATLDPVGSGLCRDQSQCNTTATAGTEAGLAAARVTIRCTTTNATDLDEIFIVNPGVVIESVDLCGSEIRTRLIPDDATIRGTFILRIVDATGSRHEFLQEERGGGTHTDSFQFAALPTEVELTRLEAEWRVGDCAVGARDDEEAHFMYIGNIRHTQYNCPASGDATCIGGGDTQACFSNNQCHYQGPDNVPTTWFNQVTDAAAGTGCGSVTGRGNVQIDFFCPRNMPPGGACMGLEIFRLVNAPNGSCRTGVDDTTVAVDDHFLNGNIPCGTNICIRTATGSVQKTVSDRCPGCGTGRIDNFSASTACGILDFAAGADTLRLYN